MSLSLRKNQKNIISRKHLKFQQFQQRNSFKNIGSLQKQICNQIKFMNREKNDYTLYIAQRSNLVYASTDLKTNLDTQINATSGQQNKKNT